MAYQARRWNENAGGMTGHGALAIYDGSGTAVQDGDVLDLTGPVSDGSINANNFFTGEEVKDAIRRATRGKSVGEGLLCFLHGRARLILDTLEIYETTVQGQRVDRVRCRGNASGNAWRVQ